MSFIEEDGEHGRADMGGEDKEEETRLKEEGTRFRRATHEEEDDERDVNCFFYSSLEWILLFFFEAMYSSALSWKLLSLPEEAAVEGAMPIRLLSMSNLT